MKVQKETYWSIRSELTDKSLGKVDLWIQVSIRFLPSPIKISAAQRTPVIAMNNSIRIHHWDDFENKSVSEPCCIFSIANQILNKPFDDPAGDCLTWMRTSNHNDGWPLR